MTFNATGGFQTPRKISIRTNSCVLCGFSFIETEITSSGERIVHKRFTQKVKLNLEKISIICDVISNFQLDPDIDKDNGVCVKCFRKVKNAKYQKDSLKIREELTASRARVVQMTLNLPSPDKLQSEKRLLRSPATTQQSKQMKTFPNTVIKRVTNIPTFDMLLEKASPRVSNNGKREVTLQTGSCD